MSSLNKYISGFSRDPNAWLNRVSGEVNANRAQKAVADDKASSISFISTCSNFLSGLASALKGGGGFVRELEAPLYPYDNAHAYDLKCLGADMYAAVLSYSTAEKAHARRTRSGTTIGQGNGSQESA